MKKLERQEASREICVGELSGPSLINSRGLRFNSSPSPPILTNLPPPYIKEVCSPMYTYTPFTYTYNHSQNPTFHLSSMAETHPTQSVTVDENKLKYLDFVQVAALYVVVSLTTVYEYAKSNSGPLKPGVQTVEGTVKTVIGPVYDKYHNVPLELLTFVDRKVDEVLSEMDRHVPLLIKQASSQARSVASEIKRAGLVETATNVAKSAYVKYEPVAEEYYYKYEPVAEKYVVVAWSSLNRLPLVPQLAHILVPTASYWAERYNQSVGYFVSKGYAVSYYLPLVPIERIAKVFKASENGHALSNGDGDVVMSE